MDFLMIIVMFGITALVVGFAIHVGIIKVEVKPKKDDVKILSPEEMEDYVRGFPWRGFVWDRKSMSVDQPVYALMEDMRKAYEWYYSPDENLSELITGCLEGVDLHVLAEAVEKYECDKEIPYSISDGRGVVRYRRAGYRPYAFRHYENDSERVERCNATFDITNRIKGIEISFEVDYEFNDHMERIIEILNPYHAFTADECMMLVKWVDHLRNTYRGSKNPKELKYQVMQNIQHEFKEREKQNERQRLTNILVK